LPDADQPESPRRSNDIPGWTLAPSGQPIIVVDYNPVWPNQFRSLRARIAGALRHLAVTVEHVGSTAVPGLAAKPIIDIDVLLVSAQALPAAIERLARVGYTHQGDLGIAGREAFRSPGGTIAHHLYVCPPPAVEFRRHMAFRNFLRTHPKEAQEYGDLKKFLAAQFPEDRDAYLAGKSELVGDLTQRALALKRRPLDASIRQG
jgi:GrpB-like predicted nucleotidyltransferase (UPF0157 family)